MLLRYRHDDRLASINWHLLEFASTHHAEIIARRIVHKVPEIFGRNAVELFFCTAFLNHGWIFARSSRQDLLKQLKSIRGLSVNREAQVEHSYVAQLLEEARSEHHRRVNAITNGSFARIIDGFTRDYCGTVENLRDGIATVTVQGLAMRFSVRTPVANLEDLSHLPQSQRVFYSAAKGAVSGSARTQEPDSCPKQKMERRPARRSKVSSLLPSRRRLRCRSAGQRSRIQHLL